MKPEHEKLLRQLFFTWDISDGIGERDFGFVRCKENATDPGTVDVFGVDGTQGIYQSNHTVKSFEAGVGSFLKKLVSNQGSLSERLRLDSIEFDLGCGRIRAPGPIGLLVVNRKPEGIIRWCPRVLVAFPERFEVVR
jgi:hypothetical protein